MLETFSQSFSATFLAVLKVFLIIGAAGLLVRRKIVTQEQIKSVSVITINIFLPCLIFSNITMSFDPAELRIWWILPLAAGLTVGFGLLLGFFIFRKELPDKKNMLPLAGVQNAGYLILPIGRAMLDDAQFERFTTYCFLYILMVSPLLWSLGKYLNTAGRDEKMHWTRMITPPFVANVLALVMVFTKTNAYIPKVMSQSIDMLGQGAVPLANFVLGAVLGSIALQWQAYKVDAIKTLAVKLLIVPVVTIVVLYFSGLRESYPLMADFFVLQAASAPATGLILQVRRYGGDELKISSIMLIHYLACILTMPFWMAVWGSL